MCSVSSDVDVVPGHCGEEGVEPENEAPNIAVDLWSTLDHWSYALGSDRKNKILNTSD